MNFTMIVPPGYNVVWYYDQAPDGKTNYGILRVYEGGNIIGYTSISPSYPQLYSLGNGPNGGQRVWDSALFDDDKATNQVTQLDVTSTGTGPDWTIQSVFDVQGSEQSIQLGVSLIAQRKMSEWIDRRWRHHQSE